MEKFKKWIRENNRIIEYGLFVFCCLSLFLAIHTSSFYSDDTVYACKWLSDQPLQSFKDIYEYQYLHYFEWGGRTVAHSLLQVLFLMGKPYSSLCLTVCYFGIARLICKIASVKERYMTLLVCGLLYFLNPNFKETVLWYTGAANYMLTMGLILLVFLPLRDRIEGSTKKSSYLFLPLAFLAGWCNENMSTTFALVELYVVYEMYKQTKRIDWYVVWMFVCTCIGCAFMILAPGNMVRAKGFTGGMWMALLYRGHGQVSAWFTWLLPILVVYLLSKNFLTTKGIEECKVAKVCLYWAMASMLVMLASPTYPDRATFGSFVLIMISTISNLSKLKDDQFCMMELAYLIAFGMGASNLALGLVQLARNLGANIPG